MTDNSETCGHCGTANPVGQDFCIKCHQPLTASAEEGIRENLEAEEQGGLFGAGQGAGLGLGGLGGGIGLPLDTTSDDATHHWMPPRRS